MYNNSLALRTKGSMLFTFSCTSPAKWDRLCPSLLKWNPLGFSNSFLLLFCSRIMLEPGVIKKITQIVLCFIWAGQNAVDFRSTKLGGLRSCLSGNNKQSIINQNNLNDFSKIPYCMVIKLILTFNSCKYQCNSS